MDKSNFEDKMKQFIIPNNQKKGFRKLYEKQMLKQENKSASNIELTETRSSNKGAVAQAIFKKDSESRSHVMIGKRSKSPSKVSSTDLSSVDNDKRNQRSPQKSAIKSQEQSSDPQNLVNDDISKKINSLEE